MNSVLQCLTHTPPLAETLLESKAALSEGQNGASALRMTQVHIQRVLQGRVAVVAPVPHARNLRQINRR